MTSPDPVNAALDRLAAHREQITRLDDREAGHFAAISGRLTEIADLLTGIGGIVNGHAAALARLEELDRQVTGLTAQLAKVPPDGEDRDGWQPGAAPKWWKLTGEARQDAIGRLEAWVEQVYRPGYGQLAATLGPCWKQHPLCLYGLDILSDLWSVLYLRGRRTAGMLWAQAEYQTRVLPALAEQMMTETSRCGHSQARSPVNGHARSAP